MTELVAHSPLTDTSNGRSDCHTLCQYISCTLELAHAVHLKLHMYLVIPSSVIESFIHHNFRATLHPGVLNKARPLPSRSSDYPQTYAVQSLYYGLA